jgi:hypothetical protein
MIIPEPANTGRGLTDPQSATMPSPSDARELIRQKHGEYQKNARRNQQLYYTTRLVAGLSAGLLAFVVSSYPTVATVLAILIVVATVMDYTLDPKGNWELYSKATDLLAIGELKARGEYDQAKEQLDVLLATETRKLESLVDLENLLNKIRDKK